CTARKGNVFLVFYACGFSFSVFLTGSGSRLPPPVGGGPSSESLACLQLRSCFQGWVPLWLGDLPYGPSSEVEHPLGKRICKRRAAPWRNVTSNHALYD